MTQTQIKSANPFSAIMWIAMSLFAIFILFTIAKGIYTILSFIAPLLFIGSFILDRSVIINYGKFLWDKLKNNTLIGIGITAISIIAFPLLTGYFFLKSLLKYNVNKKIKDFEAKEQGEYTDYENIEDDFLSLPELEKSTPIKDEDKKDEYTDMF